MVVAVVNSLDEFNEIIARDEVSVFDFWAPWCGPCRTISPIFEGLSNNGEHPNVNFYKVDVDEQQEISQQVGIKAMPTFIAFKGGEKLNDLVGANPAGLTTLITTSGNA